MSESESETVPKCSAIPEESRQPGSSNQATPGLNEEWNITQPEPEPVPNTSGPSLNREMPADPGTGGSKKKGENWEDSIISAFKCMKISGEGNKDDDHGEGGGEGEDKEKRGKKLNVDYMQVESTLLELSINPRDTYPQVCDKEDEPQPRSGFSSTMETETSENEQQPVREENFIEEDAAAPALGSPPPHPLRTSPLSENVMSGVPFYDLDLPKKMIMHLRVSLGITMATILQEKAIPILMRARDAFMHARSGSGKTVAFTIPLIQHLLLVKPQVFRRDGIRILVIVPTRECVRRTYQTIVTMVRPAPWLEVGQFGGDDRFGAEKETVERGPVILVTTPMRFLNQLRRMNAIFLKNLSCLVVDGLDEIFERGDNEYLSDIITVLDKGLNHLHHLDHLSTYKKEHVGASRQTILVSAKITQEVARFTGLNTTNPMMIDDRLNSPPRPISLPVGKRKDERAPSSLYNQFFMIVPERMKLVALVGFVMWKCKVADDRRILVFAGTQTMADYFANLFYLAYGKKDPECEEESAEQLAGLEVYSLNPFMSQKQKVDLFAKFSRTNCGILFCTDNAVRGVDLPRVEWIIHLHAPTCAADYLARIGLSSPGFQVSYSMVFLLSAEKGYVEELENHDIPLKSIRFRQSFRYLWAFYPPSHTIDDITLEIQTKMEDIVHRSPQMRDSACLAFASWCRLYSSYPQNLKHIFRFTNVHMDNYVHSFGLREHSAFVIGHAKTLHLGIRRKRAKKRRAPAEDEESPQEPSAKLPFPLLPLSAPESPEVPQVPEAPEAPEAPETPEAPEAPETPETPESPESPVPAPVATEHDDVVYAHAETSGDPSASDHAGSRKRKNYEEMERSDGEEECPEKRAK